MHLLPIVFFFLNLAVRAFQDVRVNKVSTLIFSLSPLLCWQRRKETRLLPGLLHKELLLSKLLSIISFHLSTIISKLLCDVRYIILFHEKLVLFFFFFSYLSVNKCNLKVRTRWNKIFSRRVNFAHHSKERWRVGKMASRYCSVIQDFWIIYT